MEAMFRRDQSAVGLI